MGFCLAVHEPLKTAESLRDIRVKKAQGIIAFLQVILRIILSLMDMDSNNLYSSETYLTS